MSRTAISFLIIVAPVLAIVLALLGLETLASNLVGWFLLVLGVVFLMGLVIVYWIRKEAFWESRMGGNAAQDEGGDRSFWLILPGMVAAFFLPPLEMLYFPPLVQRPAWMQFVGLGLALLGVVLFMWARRSLRASYSGHLSVKQEQPLVQSGPYHTIRHPAYLGYLLMALGVSLGYASLAGLVSVLLLLIPGLVYRIRVEEGLLEVHFGEQYRQYASRTKRLIPGIW